MRTPLITLATACLAVAGGGAYAAASGTAQDPSGGYRTIVVVERAVTDTTADTGPAGDSRGDVLAFANPVYDETDTHRVGRDNGSCVRTVVGTAYDCQWSLSLGNGQLMVQGPFYDARDSSLTITGGTGAWRGAHGEMRLHARDAAGSSYTFTYRVAT